MAIARDNRERFDALVIGAGPAGSVAASLLARSGLRTLLVDRHAFPRSKVCGGCLAPSGVRALEAAGMEACLGASPRPTLERFTLVTSRTRAGLPIEPYVAVERSVFDARLVDTCVDHGVDFRDRTRGRVRPDGGVELEGTEEPSIICPRVVLVADGIAGTALTLRPEFDWLIRRSGPMGLGALADHRPGFAESRGVTMLCSRVGYLGAAPIGDGRWTLAAAIRPSVVRELGPRAGIGQLCAQVRVCPPTAADRWRGVPQLTRRRQRVGSRSVLAIGDAAGYAEPLTGEGMSWAIESAVHAVPHAIAIAQRGADGSAWHSHWCALHRRRRLLCRGVAALARHPAALTPPLAILKAIQMVRGSASRRCESVI